jgi:hypothetical protein
MRIVVQMALQAKKHGGVRAPTPLSCSFAGRILVLNNTGIEMLIVISILEEDT